MVENFLKTIFLNPPESYKYSKHFLLLKKISRRPVNLLQASFFSAHLPKFNPAIPKLQELGEDLQASYSKVEIA